MPQKTSIASLLYVSHSSCCHADPWLVPSAKVHHWHWNWNLEFKCQFQPRHTQVPLRIIEILSSSHRFSLALKLSMKPQRSAAFDSVCLLSARESVPRSCFLLIQSFIFDTRDTGTGLSHAGNQARTHQSIRPRFGPAFQGPGVLGYFL